MAAKKRTHKAKRELENQRLTPTQIRANKCEASKARNARIKEERQKVITARNEAWRSLSYEDQLKELRS